MGYRQGHGVEEWKMSTGRRMGVQGEGRGAGRLCNSGVMRFGGAVGAAVVGTGRRMGAGPVH